MSYITQSDLESRVPPAFIVQALDDDGDGEADAGLWDKVASAVDAQINGRLEGRYAVPLAAPVPAVVIEAALVLAAEALYLRRGISGDQNPWSKQADGIRDRLERIGSGKEALKNEVSPARSGGAVIGEPARTFDAAGRLMV
jgi:phage gp36-like protein